ALVPGDAQAFATVRVADVWKLDLTQMLLKMAPIPGGDPTGGMEKEIGLTPNDIERATFAVLDWEGKETFLICVATNKAYDRQKLLANAGQAKVETEYKGKKIRSDGNVAIYLADDRTFVVGPERSIKACIDHQASPKKMDDGLSAALKL